MLVELPSTMILRSYQRGGSDRAASKLGMLFPGATREEAGRYAQTSYWHPRKGTYRLRLRTERTPKNRLRYLAKIWRDPDPEPSAWMLDTTRRGEGAALAGVGLYAFRCAVQFDELTLAGTARVAQDRSK